MSKRKDKEADRAYEREYYHRTKNTPRGKAKRERIKEYRKTYYPKYYEKNREKVIEDVRNRRLNEYGGTCKICGKRTMGQSKKNPGPSFCMAHRKEQWVEKKHTEEKRREWREAKRKQRERERAGITVATRDEPKSKKRSVSETPQGRLAAATRKTQSFSHLTRNEDRAQDEKSENQPAPRKWASS